MNLKDGDGAPKGCDPGLSGEGMAVVNGMAEKWLWCRASRTCWKSALEGVGKSSLWRDSSLEAPCCATTGEFGGKLLVTQSTVSRQFPRTLGHIYVYTVIHFCSSFLYFL